jgi:hypothetical protein
MWTDNRTIIGELLFVFNLSMIKTAYRYEMVTKYLILIERTTGSFFYLYRIGLQPVLH